MSSDYVVLESNGHYIFRKRDRWSYSTPTHAVLEDGTEINIYESGFPFSINKKPVELFSKSTQRNIVGYGDLSVEEYQRRLEELESKGTVIDEDDDEIEFDDLDHEYAYKRFLKDHPQRVEHVETTTPVDFVIFSTGTEEEEYIRPISNMRVDSAENVDVSQLQYYLSIPHSVIRERFKNHFLAHEYNFSEYSNKVSDLGRYQNHDALINYSISRQASPRVEGSKIFACNRVGTLEQLVERRDQTFKEIDDLAESIKSKFSPASEIMIAEMISMLESIQSRARTVTPMQKSRAEKDALVRLIATTLDKLRSV